MSFISDFKAFAMKGNIIDMAVGVIIGAAFGKIVSSLVDDILMPLIGTITGGVDFTTLHCSINGADIMYGQFIQNTVDFLIIAFAIFVFLRFLMKLQKKQEEAPAPAPAPTKEEVLLTEIRDLLKEKK